MCFARTRIMAGYISNQLVFVLFFVLFFFIKLIYYELFLFCQHEQLVSNVNDIFSNSRCYSRKWCQKRCRVNNIIYEFISSTGQFVLSKQAYQLQIILRIMYATHSLAQSGQITKTTRTSCARQIL